MNDGRAGEQWRPPNRKKRMRENLDILAFMLDADDMAKIATLDDPEERWGPTR